MEINVLGREVTTDHLCHHFILETLGSTGRRRLWASWEPLVGLCWVAAAPVAFENEPLGLARLAQTL